jgi:hypothetical protein
MCETGKLKAALWISIEQLNAKNWPEKKTVVIRERINFISNYCTLLLH